MGQLRGALEDIETSQHHLHLSGEKLLAQARDGLKASEIGYEAGKVSLTEWIAAAQTVRDLESMRRQQSGDFEAAVAQLEAVVGTTISNK